MKKVDSVQVLRGIAALMVVVVHTYVHLAVRNNIVSVPVLADVGRSGVDIFFVISGFIMVFISTNKFGQSGAARDFLIRRIIRVVPLYWFYTAAYSTLMIVFPTDFSAGKQFDLIHLLTSLLFIPAENGIGDIKPILGLGWTLNYEMYFYLIFSVLLLNKKTFFLPLLTSILMSGVLIGSLVPQEIAPVFSVMTSSMLIDFLMGCFIGNWLLSDVSVNRGLCYLSIVAGAIGLLSTGMMEIDLPRVIRWGVPSALLVFGSVFLEKQREINFSHWVIKLGDSSYSLYLSHLFTINAMGKIWRTFIGGWYEIFIMVTIPAALIVGYLSYLIIERPVTNYLHRLYEVQKGMINKKVYEQ